MTIFPERTWLCQNPSADFTEKICWKKENAKGDHTLEYKRNLLYLVPMLKIEEFSMIRSAKAVSDTYSGISVLETEIIILILIASLFPQDKSDMSASNSLKFSIFEGLDTLCAPDAVCFSRQIPHTSGRIFVKVFALLEHYRVIFNKAKDITQNGQCHSSLNDSFDTKTNRHSQRCEWRLVLFTNPNTL